MLRVVDSLFKNMKRCSLHTRRPENRRKYINKISFIMFTGIPPPDSHHWTQSEALLLLLMSATPHDTVVQSSASLGSFFSVTASKVWEGGCEVVLKLSLTQAEKRLLPYPLLTGQLFQPWPSWWLRTSDLV